MHYKICLLVRREHISATLQLLRLTDRSCLRAAYSDLIAARSVLQCTAAAPCASSGHVMTIRLLDFVGAAAPALQKTMRSRSSGPARGPSQTILGHVHNDIVFRTEDVAGSSTRRALCSQELLLSTGLELAGAHDDMNSNSKHNR